MANQDHDRQGDLYSISCWNSYDKNILYTTMARQRLRCAPGVVDNASGSEEHTLPAVITRCLLPDRSPCELVKILRAVLDKREEQTEGMSGDGISQKHLHQARLRL